MSNYFKEFSSYLKQCYGGYCSLCRKNKIEPVYYQKFADNFEINTKNTFKLLHKEELSPTTKIVNLNKNPYDVYIGRGSKWGNPYSHIYGKGIYVKDRETAIKKYEEYIRNKPELINDLHELKGKLLGCFCKPKSCHGDILIKLIKELKI